MKRDKMLRSYGEERGERHLTAIRTGTLHHDLLVEGVR